jgi:hypothetical protein
MPRNLCDTSQADDGTTSCREAFDAAILDCKNTKLPDGTPDFDAQLVCNAQARAARFTRSQACALAVQPAQDKCGVDFSDCLEFCG